MKRLLILGAGTAGTMMANHLKKKLDLKTWQITLVDQSETHYYQPGFLFLPFGVYTEKEIQRPINSFIPRGVNRIYGHIDRIDGEANLVFLEEGIIPCL